MGISNSILRTGALLLFFVTSAGAFGANSITTPDTGGIACSLALDANGFPVVSHWGGTNDQLLQVLRCGDANCSSGNISVTPDNSAFLDEKTALVLDSNGFPVVAYWDGSDLSIKILHCGDAVCSTGNSIFTVDTIVDLPTESSLVLDANGFPVLIYQDFDTGDLKLLHCGDANCSNGNSTVAVDQVGNFDAYASLELDMNGFPVVSYYDPASDDLKVLHCGDATCSSGNSIVNVDTVGDVGQDTSLALDANGFPVVSYRDVTNGDLKVLHCGDANCNSSNSIVSVDTVGNVGSHTSMVLDASGFPVVSYTESPFGDLKVLHCGDANCSSGNSIETFAGESLLSTSIKLDTNGNPVVSYRDNGQLKILHCGNPNCSPNSAPVADANGPYQGLPNVGIVLDASGSSDPETDPLTYDWMVDSPNCLFDNVTLESPLLTCTQAGTYTVTVTVGDSELTDSSDASVNVMPPEQAVQEVSMLVDALVDDETLKSGQANGLKKPLSNVERSLSKGMVQPACSQSQDFIAGVQEKTPNPLDPVTAAALISEAETIRLSLGCD